MYFTKVIYLMTILNLSGTVFGAFYETNCDRLDFTCQHDLIPSKNLEEMTDKLKKH